MNFKLDTRKAIEASVTLLRLVRGHVMDRKRLLALLYLADRECLKRTGRPIIGGTPFAMKHGPIHSEILDFINGKRFDQSLWSNHFENVEIKRVHLVKNVGIASLSEAEVELLNEITERYAAFDTWELADETHELDEYKQTYVENTSTEIPLEKIIDAVGQGSAKAVILQNLIEKAEFDRLFAKKNVLKK
jgi:uncharacterized phage-associated protein